MNEATIKLVLAGPMGAGKSCALASLADIAPVSTEMPLLEGASGDKTTTTVAFDFATIALDDSAPLFVFGMPGQEHFSHMRPIILEGALGVILLLDGSQSSQLISDCNYWLDDIQRYQADMPTVIGITHSDLNPAFSLNEAREVLRKRKQVMPIFTVDAREREHMQQLIRALLTQLN